MYDYTAGISLQSCFAVSPVPKSKDNFFLLCSFYDHLGPLQWPSQDSVVEL